MENYFQSEIVPLVQEICDESAVFSDKRSKARKALKLVLHNHPNTPEQKLRELAVSGSWHGRELVSTSKIVNQVSAPMTCLAWCVMLCHEDRFGGRDNVIEHLYQALRDHTACQDGRSGPVFLLSKYIDDAAIDTISRIVALDYGLDISLATQSDTSKPQAASCETKEQSESLPDAMHQAINLMLQNTKHHSIEHITETIDAQRNKIAELEDSLSKAASAPRIQQTITVQGTGEIPSGNVVVKKAFDVFEGTKAPLFDIDVPVGEWDGVHPYVPEKDENYVFNADTLVPLLVAIRDGQNPWLKGHTGTGKTTLAEQIYARLNLPVYRVNLDSDITRGELVGREVLTSKDGSTVTKFVDGIIPKAMQEPCLLLLDEVDASRPDLGFVLQRLTEGNGFMLLEDGGRTVQPHPFFRIVATANTNGRGDDTGLYSGTRALGAAFINRFKPYIDVEYMPADEERALLVSKTGIGEEDARTITNYATEHRVSFMQANLTLPCSPRDTMSLASSFLTYSALFQHKNRQEQWELAFAHTLVNAADSDDAQVIRGFINRVIGE